MRKVEGCDYLYVRGRSYCVRAQVPLALQAKIERRELKAAVGKGDFAAARRDRHAVIAEFLNTLQRARQVPSDKEHEAYSEVPDRLLIEQAVYDHNKRVKTPKIIS